MIHYHGTPITPRDILLDLAGCNFCVSFAAPAQVEICHQIGQSVMLDNGAFSFWNKKKPTNWPGYMDWAEPWLDYQTTWAVIPDVIGGTAEENDVLLVDWFKRGLKRGAPVWHLHEPLDRLQRLCQVFPRVCFGSSAEYRNVGSVTWHRRMEEAFNSIDGTDVWLHMLRGMKMSGSDYPFSSVDSADVAVNHHRPQNTALKMVRRWDALQNPAKWVPRNQLTLEGVA